MLINVTQCTAYDVHCQSNLKLWLQYKQSCKREDEPPEEVLGGGEEGLYGSARGEEFCDGKHIEAKDHHENGRTECIGEFFAKGLEFHFSKGVGHDAEAKDGGEDRED